LLDGLSKQSYPAERIEVIVVADGCSDDTLQFLSGFKPPYSIKFAEQRGLGAANARNYGASLASGDVLIFLDDDIEPSPGLVAAHVAACKDNKTLVVGYSPIPLKQNSGIFHLVLTAWWDQKYASMETRGYRRNFQDMLSGNFSISANLFNTHKGFNSHFRCREDYEFGFRLINDGVNINFCKDAWGFHRDDVTDEERSYKRKKLEGYWDVEFFKIHPEVLSELELRHILKTNNFPKKRILSFIFSFPVFFDLLARIGQFLSRTVAYFKLRGYWRRLHQSLIRYWYIRGVSDNVNKTNKIISLINTAGKLKANGKELDIDIGGGCEPAERLLDQEEPSSIRIFYNRHLVGCLGPRPGFERLKGKHLKSVIEREFVWEMMESLSLDHCTRNNR
jgi:glycosyltransferase involved in cell wall biosynthesis